MSIVYVISPYEQQSDPEQNAEQIREFCQTEYDMGNIPLAPGLYFSQIVYDEEMPSSLLEMGLEVLERCDVAHVYGQINNEMMREIRHAEECDIPVRYMSEW